MRVRQLVALGQASIAAGLMCRPEVERVLEREIERTEGTLALDLFLRRGIGRPEAARRGLDGRISAQQERLQLIRRALLRL